MSKRCARLACPTGADRLLGGGIADVVERTRGELSADDAATLDRFVGDLPHRFVDIAACGIPDTLVHGDFHPGNVRGSAARLTLLDWGDCGVGHPMLDQPAFISRVAAEYGAAIRAHWNRQWLTARPGCDPERASMLLAPVAAARQAVLYSGHATWYEVAAETARLLGLTPRLDGSRWTRCG